MDTDTEKGFLYSQETHQIIGCAFEVLNTIGHGLHEKSMKMHSLSNLVCEIFRFHSNPNTTLTINQSQLVNTSLVSLSFKK